MRTPAWEDPGARFPGNLVETWWTSLREPSAFFRGAAAVGGGSRPILYFLIIVVIASFFTLVWSAVYATPFPGFSGLDRLFPTEEAERAATALRFFAAPFAALGCLALWGLVLHGFITLLAPDHRALGATVKAASYAAGPCALQILPFIGFWLAGVWMFGLTWIGIRETHGMSTGSALAALLLAILVPSALAVTLVAVFLTSIVASLA